MAIKDMFDFFKKLSPRELELLHNGLEHKFTKITKNDVVVQNYDIEFEMYQELLKIISENPEISISIPGGLNKDFTFGDAAEYLIKENFKGFRKHY